MSACRFFKTNQFQLGVVATVIALSASLNNPEAQNDDPKQRAIRLAANLGLYFLAGVLGGAIGQTLDTVNEIKERQDQEFAPRQLQP